MLHVLYGIIWLMESFLGCENYYPRTKTKGNDFIQFFKVVSNGYLLMFKYSEKATKFCEIFILVSPMKCQSKVSWRFRKILWPSQNIWTLSQCTLQWDEILYDGAFTISCNPTVTRLSWRGHAIYEIEEKYSWNLRSTYWNKKSSCKNYFYPLWHILVIGKLIWFLMMLYIHSIMA